MLKLPLWFEANQYQLFMLLVSTAPKLRCQFHSFLDLVPVPVSEATNK